MTNLGSGFCYNGYYAGWNDKGKNSLEACHDVCLSEPQCTYAAWKNGATCSRYYGVTCNQDGSKNDGNFENYALYKKQLPMNGKLSVLPFNPFIKSFLGGFD